MGLYYELFLFRSHAIATEVLFAVPIRLLIVRPKGLLILNYYSHFPDKRINNSGNWPRCRDLWITSDRFAARPFVMAMAQLVVKLNLGWPGIILILSNPIRQLYR